MGFYYFFLTNGALNRDVWWSGLHFNSYFILAAGAEWTAEKAYHIRKAYRAIPASRRREWHKPGSDGRDTELRLDQ